MIGMMLTDVHLLGTSLKLQEGQTVSLTEAPNLPPRTDGKPQYFARPENGKWSDGIERNEEDSILIEADDVVVIHESPNRSALGRGV